MYISQTQKLYAQLLDWGSRMVFRLNFHVLNERKLWKQETLEWAKLYITHNGGLARQMKDESKFSGNSQIEKP
jgi:hypothetical protein